jgi:hypothetical protein
VSTLHHQDLRRPRSASCECSPCDMIHGTYCRQPESGIVDIDVRGSIKGSFPISHDLRSAMRAVHHHRWSDWFWIDALCIDQSSNDEKNDQVPRMRDIYEMAYAGFIWLGNLCKNSAFRPLRRPCPDGTWTRHLGLGVRSVAVEVRKTRAWK